MCLLSLKNQSYMICSSTFTFVLSFIQHFPQVWSAFWTSTSRVWRASRRPTSTATTSLYSRHPWRFSSKDYKVMIMIMGRVMHYHDGNAGRGTETEDSLQKRLTQAAADLEWVPTFNTIATRHWLYQNSNHHHWHHLSAHTDQDDNQVWDQRR